MFWDWLWGVAGALLAVPLLAVTKILCDHIEVLTPLGHLLGAEPPTASRRQVAASLARRQGQCRSHCTELCPPGAAGVLLLGAAGRRVNPICCCGCWTGGSTLVADDQVVVRGLSRASHRPSWRGCWRFVASACVRTATSAPRRWSWRWRCGRGERLPLPGAL